MNFSPVYKCFKKYICMYIQGMKRSPKICCITNKGKRKNGAMNEWENDDFDIFWALYSVYKNLGQFFFYTYLLTCFKKNTSILLKVKYASHTNVHLTVVTHTFCHMHVENLLKGADFLKIHQGNPKAEGRIYKNFRGWKRFFHFHFFFLSCYCNLCCVYSLV